jgi:hypothetical protein
MPRRSRGTVAVEIFGAGAICPGFCPRRRSRRIAARLSSELEGPASLSRRFPCLSKV